jgi:7-carboxy-7-deazaguanine synthase
MRVSEHFFSVQGESSTIGKPAVFLRLQGCNLLCKWCDTVEVWEGGRSYSNDGLSNLFRDKGYDEALERGAHLIITGGEPLIQQNDIEGFLRESIQVSPYTEIETNGTIKPSAGLDKVVDQYNVSPKTSNSGMPKRRINSSALSWFAANNKAQFKFVVEDEKDIHEIKHDFLERYNIASERVWIMPQASTRQKLIERGETIVELCKKNGFNFSPRLQLMIWDQATGV